MSWKEKFFDFLKRFFSFFKKNRNSTPLLSEPLSEDNLEQTNIEIVSIEDENEEGRINVAKRTLLTRLYALEQEIVMFKDDFPKEYGEFISRIEVLRENYNSSLEEIKKILTFEIDPELDSYKTMEISKLERDIKKFLDKEVRFSIISKRLQRLIKKLNILYNVSIFHCRECEKAKVISQLKDAVESETKVVREFKECDYILNDTQLRERIVNLISYADYQIFKTSIRNSNQIPETIVNCLVIMTEFDGFNYLEAFKAFVKDEISDLGELLPFINDEACQKLLNKELSNLFTDFTYSDSTENQILDISFWNNFFDFESNLFEMLKVSGVEKKKIKVRLIDRMDINVDEKDVLTLPITNAYLSLTSLYSKTQDKKILLIIKLLKAVSNNITYKEIYFLLILFDAIGVVENYSNELKRYIEKYLTSCPYDYKTISERKERVFNSLNKEYVVVFTLNDYEKEIVSTLENLNIDFQVTDDKVLINSFYFNGLDNVLKSLRTNTQNTTT